jgi:PIN domain nuclease of toxin-antitoxin system
MNSYPINFLGMALLKIEPEPIFAISALPFYHCDPFDRLLFVVRPTQATGAKWKVL